MQDPQRVVLDSRYARFRFVERRDRIDIPLAVKVVSEITYRLSVAKKSIARDVRGDFPPGRCPFLALSVHPRAAKGSKRRHKPKARNRTQKRPLILLLHPI